MHRRRVFVRDEAVVGWGAHSRHLLARLRVDSQVDDGAVLGEQRLQLVLGRVVWNVAQEQLVVVAILLRGAALAAIISVVLVAAGIAGSAILLLPEWSLAARGGIAADGSLLVGATSLRQRSAPETTLLVLLLLLGRLSVVLVATTHRSTGVTRLQTRWRRRKTGLATRRDIAVALLLLVVLLLLRLLLVRRLLLLLLVMVGRDGGEAKRSRSTGTARLNQVGIRFRFVGRLLVLLLVTQVAMVVGIASLGRGRIIHGL